MDTNRKRNGTRLQFGIRTLLILATIVGPILGWYGPVAVNKLRDFYANEPTTSALPALTLPTLQIQNKQVANRIQQLRQRLAALKKGPQRPIPSPSARDQIELGMRADLWEREQRRAE